MYLCENHIKTVYIINIGNSWHRLQHPVHLVPFSSLFRLQTQIEKYVTNIVPRTKPFSNTNASFNRHVTEREIVTLKCENKTNIRKLRINTVSNELK